MPHVRSLPLFAAVAPHEYRFMHYIVHGYLAMM